MTCIVGVKSSQGLYIGGDSAVSSNNLVQTISDPKVWRKGQFVIGFAGSLRIGQIIKYDFNIPPINKREPIEYLVTAFVNSMRKTLKKAGAVEKQPKEEQDNQFLIGFQNRFFEIDETYGICEVKDEYIAIGSGTEYALGSLHSTKGKSPSKRITMALEAAAYFCEEVRPPFHIIPLKK